MFPLFEDKLQLNCIRDESNLVFLIAINANSFPLLKLLSHIIEITMSLSAKTRHSPQPLAMS